MARISSLHRLQQVDEALNANRGRIDEIEEILNADETIRKASKALEAAQGQLVAARSAAGEAEQAVASQSEKMDRTQESLYGGGVQNPRELEELQMESESLQRHMETLEDRMLDAMIDLERAENEYEKAKEDLARVQDEAASRNAGLGQERKELAVDIGRLEAVREAALASVGAAELKAYQKVRTKVGRLPLAVVEEGACGVCGLAISASKLQKVRKGDELAYCRQCGRILYGG